MNSHWLVRFGEPAVPLALVTYTHGLGGLWVSSRKKSTTRHGKLVGNNSSICRSFAKAVDFHSYVKLYWSITVGLNHHHQES